MELVESNFELLSCGEPCTYHHPAPPLWTGKSINPKCILHTLVRILRDPMSEDQVGRQLSLLQDLKSGLTRGFWLQDIENSTKLIEILLCKGELCAVFFEYAKYLLRLSRYPPLMCRTNEILEFDKDVQSYFDFFGYMLVTTSKQIVRDLIIQSLKNLLRYKGTLNEYSMPWEMMIQQIELSNLPIIVTQYMELCNNEIYFDLVEITSSFAKFSSSMRTKLIQYGCLQILMQRLDPQWQEHLGGPRPEYETMRVDPNYSLDNSIMLIYALLDAYQNHPDDAIKKEIPCPTVEALWGFRYALRLYTIEERFKNERNFMAALCLLFVECFPNGKHVHAGIVHDFALLSTLGDVTLGASWAATIHFNVIENSDYEFKRMTMMGLILFVECLGAARIYDDALVMVALCKLLDKKSTVWNSQFHENLLLTALHVLQYVFPQHVDNFIVCNGPKKIVNVLRELATRGDYSERYHVYFQGLRFAYKMIHTYMENKCFPEEYIDEQNLLLRDINKKMFEMDLKLKNQKIMTQSINVLGLLPDNECAADVEFVIALIKRVLNPRPTDVAYIQRLFVSSISLIWKHGLHNNASFLYFIKLNGVYLLLDLIKDAGFAVQTISLGFLADMIHEGTAIPYLVTWQKDGVGILALLMNIFRKECVDIGVQLLPNGIIADPRFPLMGAVQREAFSKGDHSSGDSPSITDLFLSCRPKIYAILKLLQNKHGDTTERVNNYYKTFEINLTIDHKITRVLCENYFILKLGEMWMELDLAVKPIEPVPSHRFMLDTLLEHYLGCGIDTQKLQNNILAVDRKNEHIYEEEFYNLLRETKLGPAIAGLAEIKFLARVTNAKFRRAHVNVSERASARSIIESHRTMPEGTTCFSSGQKLTIQSDVIVDPFAPIPPKTISEDGEDRVSMFDECVSEVSLSIAIDCKEFRCDGLEDCTSIVNHKKKKRKRSKSAHKKK